MIARPYQYAMQPLVLVSGWEEFGLSSTREMRMVNVIQPRLKSWQQGDLRAAQGNRINDAQGVVNVIYSTGDSAAV
jgi:hypothetical protein